MQCLACERERERERKDLRLSLVGGTLQAVLYLGSEGTSDANRFPFLSTCNTSTQNTYWYLPESNLPVSTCVL